MTPKQITHLSKFLSLVLRHEPQRIGITLDSAGWVGVEELLDRCAAAGTKMSLAELQQVVATNEKKRFAFSEDGTRIRASQGHSVEVDLGYTPVTPPEVIYHGTPGQFLSSIREGGLRKGERHHVHLSESAETAAAVGERRGRAVILTVRAGDMSRDRMLFYQSANRVWLTDHVPPQYIKFPDT